MSKAVNVPQAPQFPLPFSHYIEAGDFVYVSGQVGVDPATLELVGDTVEEQTRQCVKNLETILNYLNLTLDHVVKMNVFVSDSQHIPAFNKVYAEIVNKPYPARTTCAVGLGSYKIEIDCIAYTKSKRGETA
ncbi:RidA family protein [Paenibacillus senegalensis]|uniref:RidA family protein n=1 Tax=Paenibacillus senegalensis TaxID=1465766 RepID=UPI000289B59F|nr:RidA family protein [Paenibacillus senegalensis]